jgi:hypothetical protein
MCGRQLNALFKLQIMATQEFHQGKPPSCFSQIFYIDTLPLPPTVATPEASPDGASQQEPLHFVFLDGTWNNSTAMLVRLQQQAERVWGEKMACLCLTPGEPSKMHSLR